MLTENALKILEARYLRKDEYGNVLETPSQLFARVATDIANAEMAYGTSPEDIVKLQSQFVHMMEEGLFLPNSPTLMNAGTNSGLGYAACYVLPVEDDMTGIFKALQQAALIWQAGGGTGFSFSRLRPSGALVRTTTGVSSGPVSFIKIFDAAAQQVKQGGKRRTANMAIMQVDHPDIEEFITCKDSENQVLSNFNMSVAITDEFMEQLKKGADYEIIDPQTKKRVDTKSAREVFRLMVQQAWKTGDPGLWFIDRANKASPLRDGIPIESTNPCGEQALQPFDVCVAKGTRVLLPKGYQNIESLKGMFSVISTTPEGNLVEVQGCQVLNKGYQNVYEIVLRNGQRLKATKDHRILTDSGWRQIQDITKGTKVRIQDKSAVVPHFFNDVLFEMLGWQVGDGWLTESKGRPSAGILFSASDEEAFDRLKPVWDQYIGKEYAIITQPTGVRQISCENRKTIQGKFLDLGFKFGTSIYKRLPPFLFLSPPQQQLSFLRGLFGADGTVAKSSGGSKRRRTSIQLASSSKELLRDVQLLLVRFGIQSNLLFGPISGRKNPQGRIYISGESALRFMELVSFSLSSKNVLFQRPYHVHRNSPYQEVVDIRYMGREEVFDIMMPELHNFLAEGMVVHNCNLGSINLGKFVIPGGVVPSGKDLTEWEEWERRIDMQHLGKIVALSVRFLDNVIDQSTYPLKKIENMAKKNRRIGLGVMGWADMLALLKIPYDSEEALELARFIMAFIQERAEDASIELAEDRGPFPNWKKSVFKPLTNPPRNVALTTVAPTGTISRIAGCSSGIEPYFALAYKSNVLDGQVLIDRVDILEQVFKSFNINVEEADWNNWANMGGSIQEEMGLPQEVRDIFKTALEISPETHVQMQAAFQTYINNSVSKTINLPNSATKEDIEKAYLLAWELGCRGITVYRDGSKSMQVLETKSTKAEPSLGGVDLVKPADMLPAVRIRIPTGHGTLFSTISYDEKSGKPLELFAWQGKAGGCTLAYMEALGRLISVSLRSGVSVEVVLEALRGIRCGHAGPHGGVVTLSLPDAIGLALERFLEKQGVDIQSPIVTVGNCPKCGETLIFQEGCEKCMVCDYSRCG